MPAKIRKCLVYLDYSTLCRLGDRCKANYMTHTTISNFGSKYANHFRCRSCLTNFNKLRLFEHVTYPTGDLLKCEWNRVEQRWKKRLDTSFFAHCPTVCKYVLPSLVAPTNWFLSIINVRPGILKYLIYVVLYIFTIRVYVPKHVTPYVCAVDASVM